MARLLISGLPEPDPGRSWCAVCVGDYKEEFRLAAGVDAAWVEKHINQAPPGDLIVLTPRNAKGAKLPPLQHAVTMTFVPNMGAVVATCWTHATAIQPGDAGEVPPGFRRPPLIQGMS